MVEPTKTIYLPKKPVEFVALSKITLEEQRELFQEVQDRKRKYSNVPGIDAYLQFDEQTGIHGSNFPHLVLINQILFEQGQRTPTYSEAMDLDRQGVLSNGVYRDFGIAVLDNQEPNKSLATKLIQQAKKRRLTLPILVHPLDLDFDKSNGYKIKDDSSLIVSGEEAVEELKRFRSNEISGVQGLYRYSNGNWNSDWDNLANSNSDGRVDWKCAEGARENLRADGIKFN